MSTETTKQPLSLAIKGKESINASEEGKERIWDEIQKNIASIGEEYHRNKQLNPEKARLIAISQLQKEEDVIKRHQTEKNIIKIDSTKNDTYDDSLGKDIDIIIALLEKNPPTKEEIYGAIYDISQSALIAPFIPEEYHDKYGEIITRSYKKYATVMNTQKFIENTNPTEVLPYFNSEYFNENPELFTRALSVRPGTILEKYEGGFFDIEEDGQTKLRDNPKFIETLNVLLAKEYPETFGKIQDEVWYRKGGASFEKISLILDLANSQEKWEGGESLVQTFIRMMHLSQSENTKDSAMFCCEHYFMGGAKKANEWREGNVNYWNDIKWAFPDSELEKLKQERILENIEKQKNTQIMKEWTIYALIYSQYAKGEEWGKTFAKTLFANIPELEFTALLKKLPKIEEFCDTNNQAGILDLVKEWDIEIDPLYICDFLNWIAAISYLGTEEKNNPLWVIKQNFYFEASKKLSLETLNIEKERDAIVAKSTSSKNWHSFEIIDKSMPNLEPWERQKKNTEFHKLLKDILGEDTNVCIKIPSSEFKRRLLNIFGDSPSLRAKLMGANGWKEALGIIAQALEEKHASETKELKEINPKFESTLSELRKNKPEEYRKLRDILASNRSIEEKIKTLKTHGLIQGDIPEEKKEAYIQLLTEHLETKTNLDGVKDILHDKKKLEAFNTYWNGGSLEVFNKAIEKRDQEIQQEEKLWTQEKQEGKNNPMKSYDTLQSLSIHFQAIENGKIVTYKVGNSDVYIKKDSENEISIFSDGVPIRGIKVTDKKNPQEDIQKAMNSVRFIKDCGLSIFGTNLPKIIEIINNKQKWKGERKINLADGLDAGGEEEKILLRYIAKMIDIDAALSIENLKKQFNEISNTSGLLSRFQKKPGYVTNNSLNMTTILGDLEKTGI